jgi:hypothetical protein
MSFGFFLLVSSFNIEVKQNIREPKEKEIGKNKNNLRVDVAGHVEGVEDLLVIRRRFLGS